MTTDDALHAVFTAVGTVVTVGGGGAAIAYAIFRYLGSGWLDQRFRRQLETLKHEQKRELEQLRHEISSEFSRISKIHQKEFEVLPGAWRLLHEAHGRVADLVGRLMYRPTFENVTEPQFEEFLKMSRLSEVQKDELRAAADRKAYYGEAIRAIELRDARVAQIALGNFLVLNSIFMTEELRQQFRDMNVSLATIIGNEEQERRHAIAKFVEQTNELWAKTSEMLPAIETAVQRRLHYDEA